MKQKKAYVIFVEGDKGYLEELKKFGAHYYGEMIDYEEVIAKKISMNTGYVKNLNLAGIIKNRVFFDLSKRKDKEFKILLKKISSLIK